MLMRWFVYAVLHIYAAFAPTNGESDIHKTEDFIPCEKGWFFFRDKCYKLGGKRKQGRLNWEKATERCAADGGKLATVDSKEISDFLVTFLLLDAKTRAWIGLHDKVKEANYTWQDGSPYIFKNWEPLEPNGQPTDAEDCVEMLFWTPHKRDAKSGQWNDDGCDREKAYICQAPKSSQTKKTPDPRFCSNAKGGWKYLNSCYYFVSERKSWTDAEQHCQDNFSGHLVRISDFTVELFLDYILSNLDREYWIGIKIQERLQQEWTSGWFVTQNVLSGDFEEGTCVIRNKFKKWTITQCSKKYSFICEESSVVPPVLKPPAKGAHCPELPEDWRDLGGDFCYFFGTDRKESWYKANYQCIRRGGSLLSFHSTEESAILNPFTLYTRNGIFIGLVSLVDQEDVFAWTDGSDMDYINWRSGEPNAHHEKCGEVMSDTMEWNDVSCDDLKGFICSVKKVLPNVTEIEAGSDCPSGISPEILIGASVCILLMAVLLGVAIYCFQPCRNKPKRKSTYVHLQPPVPATERPRYRTTEIIIKDEDEHYENIH